MEQRVITVNRDCPAKLVPSGQDMTLPAHAFVTLTQALGGSFTVKYNGNLARVDANNADALGLKPEVLEFPERADEQIHEEDVWQALRSVFDPEIPVNIVELGLVYQVDIDSLERAVAVEMTLTAPTCGMGPVLVDEVHYKLKQVPNVAKIDVNLTLDPPWNREMISDEAKLELGIF